MPSISSSAVSASPALGAFIGLLLFIGAIGGTSSWIAGAARVPFAAGVDAAMPAAFAKLHPKYRTPHVALIVQAIATTVLFLASVYVSVGGGKTTIQEAYDIMVNLTILIYFLPYCTCSRRSSACDRWTRDACG